MTSKKNAKGPRRAPPDEDAIYERILAAILEHRLAPGTKLGEDRLAGIFGVSRARAPRARGERLAQHRAPVGRIPYPSGGDGGQRAARQDDARARFADLSDHRA